MVYNEIFYFITDPVTSYYVIWSDFSVSHCFDLADSAQILLALNPAQFRIHLAVTRQLVGKQYDHSVM